MDQNQIKALTIKAIEHDCRLLIKGKPGVGKSDIVGQAAAHCGAKLLISHPAISDPTDYKGMPAVTDGGKAAHFLPFGDLQALIAAAETTVCFLDDIGQAAPAVQAALMQLVLARAVNGTRISPHVRFIGATNDTGHMAGVSGMIEPLKSRWDSIVELEPALGPACDWLLDNGYPAELVAFLRFQPQLLSDFQPTKELRNSPSPRGWASVGKWLKIGVNDLDVLSGAVGAGAATALKAFLGLYGELPALADIIAKPSTAPVPSKPELCIAIATGLGRMAAPSNFGAITTYCARLSKDVEVFAVRDSIRQCPKLKLSKPFADWAALNSADYLT